MLTGIAPLILLVMPKSSSMSASAGARIEDDHGVMNVMHASSDTMSHLRNLVKLSGMAGSFWSSQPTIPFSSSITRIVGGGSFSFVFLRDSLLRMLLCVFRLASVPWVAVFSIASPVVPSCQNVLAYDSAHGLDKPLTL